MKDEDGDPPAAATSPPDARMIPKIARQLVLAAAEPRTHAAVTDWEDTAVPCVCPCLLTLPTDTHEVPWFSATKGTFQIILFGVSLVILTRSFA